MQQSTTMVSTRAGALADRLLMGSRELAAFAETLSPAQWKTPVTGDGRTVGVVVHHVAHVYPLEIELSQMLAAGTPITGATRKVVDDMNAVHATEFKDVSKEEALKLLKENSQAAAEAIRRFSDSELDNAATVSLNANAPLTAQFFIEDHPVRHSFHHLEKIKATIHSF